MVGGIVGIFLSQKANDGCGVVMKVMNMKCSAAQKDLYWGFDEESWIHVLQECDNGQMVLVCC